MTAQTVDLATVYLAPDGYLRQAAVLQQVQGLTYRQLDHWTTHDYLDAYEQDFTGLGPAPGGIIGSGFHRVWHETDVPILRRVVALTNLGLQPRAAFKIARAGSAAYYPAGLTIVFHGALA